MQNILACDEPPLTNGGAQGRTKSHGEWIENHDWSKKMRKEHPAYGTPRRICAVGTRGSDPYGSRRTISDEPSHVVSISSKKFRPATARFSSGSSLTVTLTPKSSIGPTLILLTTGK